MQLDIEEPQPSDPSEERHGNQSHYTGGELDRSSQAESEESEEDDENDPN